MTTAAFVVALACVPVMAGQGSGAVSGHTANHSQGPASGEFRLRDGASIRLETTATISSAHARVGQAMIFDVVENVFVQGVLVIPKGTIVSGRITTVKPKRRLARGDQLGISIESLQAADGERVWLRGEKQATGGGHVKAMTGAVAASGVFFFPAAPFFLLLHGKGATIPEGTGVTAYVNGDTPLKRENFTNRNTERVDTLTALLQVTSNPSGAEISIDESKSGSAPFSVRLVGNTTWW